MDSEGYSLLIVDDEALAVRGIESGVDWARLGVARIHKAYNIRQAKEVFVGHPVDIMLCDIEMPQGNGLDLLTWVRAHHPRTESVILTCHADFEYARKALQLGSLDYVLKAMTYEDLEGVIRKVIEKIVRDRHLQEFSRFGELWFKNQPKLVDQFWLDLLAGTIPSGEVEIQRAAQDRDIVFPLATRVRPVLVNVGPSDDAGAAGPGRSAGAEAPRESLETVVSGELRRLVARVVEQGASIPVLKADRDNYLVVLPSESDAPRDADLLAGACREFARNFRLATGRPAFVYIGAGTTACGFVLMVEKLYGLERDNVTLKENVFRVDGSPRVAPGSDLPDMGLWSSMVAGRQFDALIRDVSAYFERMTAKGCVDASFLRQFHQDFLQMVYSSLKQSNIQARQLLSDAASIEFFDRAAKTVPAMLTWIKHVVSRIQEHSLNQQDSLSLIDKVKRYIALHVGDNPSREDLASYVYLNPDYLSRLFKKETGTTLLSYLQGIRLQYIQDLLAKTDMSIGQIAAQLGYTNFSHFTRAFKELTGMSPTEYRNSVRGLEG